MTGSKIHIHRFLGVEDVRDGQRLRDEQIQSPHFTNENTEVFGAKVS